MGTKKYTNAELESLVSELENQFGEALQKSEAPVVLKKSEDEKSDKKDEKKDDKKEDKKDDKSDKKDEKKDDEKDEKEENPFAKSEYTADDLKELGNLYAGMSKAERQAHLEALNKAEETKIEPMQKSENTLAKSQAEEIAALKKSNDELQRSMAELVQTMNKRLVKPQTPKGKALTQLSALNKSEEAPAQMTREEAKKILNKKAQTPDLAKSERELINDFCMNRVGLDRIQHLLK
jgi:hypothetical protein